MRIYHERMRMASLPTHSRVFNMSIKDLILPSNIRIDDHFWNTFSHSETEVSARWLIMFLQARNYYAADGEHGVLMTWDAFPFSHLESFYRLLRKQPRETFTFNRLDETYVQKVKGMITVTDKFVSAIASNSNLISASKLEVAQKYLDAYVDSIK